MWLDLLTVVDKRIGREQQGSSEIEPSYKSDSGEFKKKTSRYSGKFTSHPQRTVDFISYTIRDSALNILL